MIGNSFSLTLEGRVIGKVNKENRNKMVNYHLPDFSVCNTNLQRGL